MCYSNTFLFISAVLSGHGMLSSFGQLVVYVPTKVSLLLTDLIKYPVKRGSFYNELVAFVEPAPPSRLGKHMPDSFAELFADRQWK